VIAVVVLTFDPAPGMLEDCLAALRPAPAPAGDESAWWVVLVDNGGGVVARLGGAGAPVFHGVDVLVQPRNTGYAGGMNAGIRHALARGADAVMLLNDDVVVEPGWLPPLLSELTDERVGAVQPKLLFAGDPPTINSLGVALGPDGAGTDIGMHEPDDHDDRAARDLAVFTGGAVLLRREFLEDTGGFDERFFLYYEDVDLALRGHELGWRYRLAPASRVRHRGSATTSGIGTRATVLRERNRLWVLVRHRPAGDVGRGMWLSLRRLRWHPRRAHLRSLVTGLAGAPRLLVARRRAARRVSATR
jgi:hypothetical protein